MRHFCRDDKLRRDQGFTLMELLISITIVAIIVSLMFGALRMGLKVWDKGETEGILIRQLQTVRKLMKTQMASVCTEPVFEKSSGAKPEMFILKGDDTRVAFISRYAITPEQPCGLVYVKYFWVRDNERSDLMVLEKPFCLVSDYEKILRNDRENENSSGELLMGNIENLRFDYLVHDKSGNLQTKSVWNSEDAPQKEFPEAVKIHLQVADQETNMTMRLMAR